VFFLVFIVFEFPLPLLERSIRRKVADEPAGWLTKSEYPPPHQIVMAWLAVISAYICKQCSEYANQ